MHSRTHGLETSFELVCSSPDYNPNEHAVRPRASPTYTSIEHQTQCAFIMSSHVGLQHSFAGGVTRSGPHIRIRHPALWHMGRLCSFRLSFDSVSGGTRG